MIKECPECNEKIEILQIQEPNSPSTATTGTFDGTMTATFTNAITYPSTTKTYKCSNPKCWVTKINESWE